MSHEGDTEISAEHPPRPPHETTATSVPFNVGDKVKIDGSLDIHTLTKSDLQSLRSTGGIESASGWWDERRLELYKGAVKSTGGSSSYYDTVVTEEWAESIQVTGLVKCEDIILHVYGNDFDFATAYKSLHRARQTVLGTGKAGNVLSYDLNKIRYSLDKIEARHRLNFK